jgi:hypothetical protein
MLPGKDQPRSRMGFPWFGRGLPPSTRKGFATQACDLFGFACEVTAAAPEHVGACRAGMVPAARREPSAVSSWRGRVLRRAFGPLVRNPTMLALAVPAP